SVTVPAPDPLIDSGSPSGSANDPCALTWSPSSPVTSAAPSATIGAAFAASQVNASVADPPKPSVAETVIKPVPSEDGAKCHDHVPSPWSVTIPTPDPLIDSGSPSGSVNDPCAVSVSPSCPVASAAASFTTGGRSSATHENVSVAEPPKPSDAVTVTEPLPSPAGSRLHDHVPSPSSVTVPEPDPVITSGSPFGSV